MSKTASKLLSDLQIFGAELERYKQLIDEDIKTYSRDVQKTTLQQFGKNARMETDVFLSILERGGKRIRGALVMLGYEMSGGKNQAMILQAARAIEMIHAYILMIDDIQDRSVLRRGGPTAHVMLADYHRKHQLADDADHFGIAITMNAALVGAHAAQAILANLDAPENLRLNVISITNRTMMITAHGQTDDIMNEVVADVSNEDIRRVLEWKTAHYTFLNPLHVGMVLAGADCHATDAITEYAMQAGMAFQITDDIVGIFGSEAETGKSSMDDIREGKRTLLMAYAIEHAESGDKNFLIHMLGNQHLTPAEFDRCKTILLDTGALQHAKKVAADHINRAQQSLKKEAERWSSTGVQFLNGLAEYLLQRTV
jgi:geranylgeranyl diphosphate synthase type I